MTFFTFYFYIYTYIIGVKGLPGALPQNLAQDSEA